MDQNNLRSLIKNPLVRFCCWIVVLCLLGTAAIQGLTATVVCQVGGSDVPVLKKKPVKPKAKSATVKTGPKPSNSTSAQPPPQPALPSKDKKPETSAPAAPAPSSPPAVGPLPQPAPPPPPRVSYFEFDVVRLNQKGIVLERHTGHARHYLEELSGGVKLVMVEIPTGRFRMGASTLESEQARKDYSRLGYKEKDTQTIIGWQEPQHAVLVQAFYLSKFEVTQAQWRAVASLPKVLRDLPPDPSGFKGDDLPVERISWEEAVEFCERISKASGRQYRLPSEAEWEFACRAGTTTQFNLGDAVVTGYANFDGSFPSGGAPKSPSRGKTNSVGASGLANEFGLYDMHGNVSEWCLDAWHPDYQGAPADGSIWTGGTPEFRVVRGGSWQDPAVQCRCASRKGEAPASRGVSSGFRVAAVGLQ